MVTYRDAEKSARHKAAEADYGSPFRHALSRLAPATISRYCPLEADVLDVGCGSGRYALFFIEAGVRGCYTGVDISDRRWGELPLPPEFPGRLVKMDAHHLDAWDETFDFILSLTAFEHFADDARVARGVAHVLRPGAHAVIAVPGPWSYPLYGPHGYRRYSPAALRALAAQAGLTVTELRRVGGPAGWLFHFLWFFPPALARLIGKALLAAMAGFDKQRARRRFSRGWLLLDGLGNHHLRWDWGRRLHRFCLRLAAWADRALPFMPTGYLAVFRK